MTDMPTTLEKLQALRTARHRLISDHLDEWEATQPDIQALNTAIAELVEEVQAGRERRGGLDVGDRLLVGDKWNSGTTYTFEITGFTNEGEVSIRNPHIGETHIVSLPEALEMRAAYEKEYLVPF